MSVTGFNRRRREFEAQAAKIEAEILPEEKPVEEMTYQELRALAKERKIEGFHQMNTEELREALSPKTEENQDELGNLKNDQEEGENQKEGE